MAKQLDKLKLRKSSDVIVAKLAHSHSLQSSQFNRNNHVNVSERRMQNNGLVVNLEMPLSRLHTMIILLQQSNYDKQQQ